MLFKERTKKFEYKLNETEDNIIRFIDKNRHNIINSSIQSVAQECFVAPNTIMRLVKKLEYTGFTQLKLELKREIETAELFSTISPFECKNNLLRTYQLIDFDLFTKISALFQQAKRVFFYSIGDNEHICQLAVKELRIAFPHAYAINHRHEFIYNLQQANEHDIFFFVSLSGEKLEIIELAEKAKEKGAPLISVTHFNQNTLAKLTDFQLYCYSPKQTALTYNITDKTPLQFILRAFVEFYWNFSQINITN